ncbi:hypothetical protein [Saccharopolyspora rectivirgula]|jgi:hypothetical protein|uniref:hypothetical protein n=1 Tax=Saccharopolyspora rectivirgula TaxID=28042 RepID=UPI000411C45B|nr:hypothetical protein [Saccharopolyspora rectivirgula]
MDEVETMARTGERIGRLVGVGVRNARENAARAGELGRMLSKQAAMRAEQELANRGISTEQLPEVLAQVTGKSPQELAGLTRKARKRWEKKIAKSRKQLAKNTAAARKELAKRKELAAQLNPNLQPKKRRKWPWVLLVLGSIAAAAATFVLSRRPEELPVANASEDFHRPEPHKVQPAQNDNSDTRKAAAGQHKTS